MRETEISRKLLETNPLLWIKERDEIYLAGTNSEELYSGGAVQSIVKEDGGWFANVETEAGELIHVNLNEVTGVKIFKDTPDASSTTDTLSV
tara:strand:+ start:54688 stop:54963 length:276 start_codon:yes stop_codon:yes gene_type:complete